MSIDLHRITHPLRLANGSHKAGTGHGCAMNILSYITGEPTISDFPECSARPLARMVQCVNDFLADQDTQPWVPGEAPAVKFLSPEDSLLALDLAWSTVGTADTDDTTLAVWGHRILNNAHAIVTEANPTDPYAWDLVSFGSEGARLGDYVKAAANAAQAVYIAADIDALVLFVEDAIALWKDLNDVVSPEADPVVVNEAIGRMVNV